METLALGPVAQRLVVTAFHPTAAIADDEHASPAAGRRQEDEEQGQSDHHSNLRSRHGFDRAGVT